MTSNASSSKRPLGGMRSLGLLLFGVLLATASPLSAQTADTLTDYPGTATPIDTTLVNRLVSERYEAYVHRAHQRWMSLIPNLGILQYAGDIGMVSAGLGWDYGHGDRWETQFLVGYLPKFHAEQNDITLTLKENLVPWSIDCRHHGLTVQPAVFTLFVNSVLDDEFWTEEPDRYPRGYYGFSSRIRWSLGFGGRISLDIPEAKRHRANRISLYYELSTCDLYLVSDIPNDHINFGDILRLGLGVQYRFF